MTRRYVLLDTIIAPSSKPHSKLSAILRYLTREDIVFPSELLVIPYQAPVSRCRKDYEMREIAYSGPEMNQLKEHAEESESFYTCPIQTNQSRAIELQHRVVLAPLTRFRAGKKSHIPNVPLVKEYYTQRASRPGTFLITEATFIAAQAGGIDNVPGIWSQEQITAWKEITNSVHEQGSYIFLQLWAIGRAAPDSFILVNSLAPKFKNTSPLRQGSLECKRGRIRRCGSAWSEWILIDQFLQDISNQRTDDYGGSIENRSRFGLEVVEAVVDAIGADRVGVRVSPWSTYQDMRMENPIPQFAHFASSLKHTHPDLAYLHVTEPSTAGIYGKIHSESDARLGNDTSSESNDFLRAIWKPKPYISAGGYIRESALIRAEEKGDIIAFGRRFIANPDLVNRLENNIPLTQYNRPTFFVPAEDPNAAVGYIDYPFATTKDEVLVQAQL
ncbi:hypothetical protein BDQ17DRAFT_1544439 [Cyathus striatus]|nr:hypothetical protein BDQ17DRAFT_1544439 [Cyathus striatus]